MKSSYDNYSLKSLIKQPTYYKNSEKQTCIDLILTNMPRSFQSTRHRNRAAWFSSDDLGSFEKQFQKN